MVRTNPQVASQSGQMRNAVVVSVVVTIATVRRCRGPGKGAGKGKKHICAGEFAMFPEIKLNNSREGSKNGRDVGCS
jgi:hypothetical protein